MTPKDLTDVNFFRGRYKKVYISVTVHPLVSKFLVELPKVSSYISYFELKTSLCQILTREGWKLVFCHCDWSKYIVLEECTFGKFDIFL